MALVSCQECSNMISDSASSCPSCGYTYSSLAVVDSSIGFLPTLIPRTGFMIALGLFFGGIFASFFGFPIGGNIQAMGAIVFLISILLSL